MQDGGARERDAHSCVGDAHASGEAELAQTHELAQPRHPSVGDSAATCAAREHSGGVRDRDEHNRKIVLGARDLLHFIGKEKQRILKQSFECVFRALHAFAERDKPTSLWRLCGGLL